MFAGEVGGFGVRKSDSQKTSDGIKLEDENK